MNSVLLQGEFREYFVVKFTILFKACFVVDRVGMGYRSTLRLLVSGSTPRIFARGVAYVILPHCCEE